MLRVPPARGEAVTARAPPHTLARVHARLLANFILVLKMICAAGAKEAELQGASSVVRGNAVIEAMQGET